MRAPNTKLGPALVRRSADAQSPPRSTERGSPRSPYCMRGGATWIFIFALKRGSRKVYERVKQQAVEKLRLEIPAARASNPARP